MKSPDELENSRDKNIFIIASIFVFIVIACTIYTIFFKNDKKENMTKIDDLIFNETVFEVSNFEKNSSSAKIDLKELYMIGAEYKFDILIQDDQNKKIKYVITKGETKEEEPSGMILETEFTITFNYPKNTDYIKATITKGTDNKIFTIDIRDFK